MKTNLTLASTDQLAWQAFLNANQKLLTRMESELSFECDMCLSEFEVLLHLSKSPTKSLRMTELAELARLSPSGLTRRFDLMIKRGWVTRERCDQDRRGVVAGATKQGLKQVKIATPVYLKVQDGLFFNQLVSEQLAALQGMSESIARAAEFEELLETA
jgi:DNA-binding MarR family transcriptional regulator